MLAPSTASITDCFRANYSSRYGGARRTAQTHQFSNGIPTTVTSLSSHEKC